jgi:hypothetical protein
MNLTGFSTQQKAALLDLLVLGMYADGHLASAKDGRLRELLDAMEFPSDYARQQAVDGSFTRMSRQGGSPEGVRQAVRELAGAFTSHDERYQALLALDELLASDDRVTDTEGKFLSLAKQVFQAA